MEKRADIGVFGGSGLYSLLENKEDVWIETPFGSPSDKIAIAEIGGKKVAFLPRHGRDHIYPPHKIPYKANIWAMKALGVKFLIGPCAAGSLNKAVEPGHFVLCDQFVDRTNSREDTFFEGPIATHVSSADPYCSKLRDLAYETGSKLGITLHKTGTMVVIQGPRFSTRAESQWFSSMGWSVINMTGYPEAYLAREMEMCYVNISLITDYDVGILGESEPVSHEAVLEVFQKNNKKVKEMILGLIEKIPVDLTCECHQALKMSRPPGYSSFTIMPGIV